MGKFLGILILALCVLICEAAIFRPISDSHRSAALELLTPKDGSFTSLKETYEALRTFKVLGIGHQLDIKAKSCKSVVDTVGSPSSTLKDLFQALEVNGILKCELSKETFAGIASRLEDSVNTASSLLDYYYSIGSLVLIKDQTSEVDVHLGGADSVFRAIKALSQSDGRWRYSSNNPESSTFAAGIALESLAGVLSLASSEIDHSLDWTTGQTIGHESQGLYYLTSLNSLTTYSVTDSPDLIHKHLGHPSLSKLQKIVPSLSSSHIRLLVVSTWETHSCYIFTSY